MTNLDTLRHMQVGKFEIEVMRKASSEEVLSGALYLADKAPQPIPTEVPAVTTKKQTFKSFKLQQSRYSSALEQVHLHFDSLSQAISYSSQWRNSKPLQAVCCG